MTPSYRIGEPSYGPPFTTDNRAKNPVARMTDEDGAMSRSDCPLGTTILRHDIRKHPTAWQDDYRNKCVTRVII